MQCIRRGFAAIVVVVFLLCSVVRAQVLDQVPEQALIVVKVNNLQAVSAKLGKLATDLQLVAQVPQMADPLGALTEHLKITKGLDKGGEAAFAFLDPALANGDEDGALLMLWPVTDYKEFISNFEGGKPEGVSEVKFADSDKPAFVASWGKYAVISPVKEIASMKPTGVKVAGAVAKEMSTKDIVMLSNFAQLRGKLQPQLAKGKEDILGEIEKNMASGEGAKFAATAKVAVGQLIGVADAFLRDATGATYGITIGENGISSTLLAEFEPTSYIAGIAKGYKNTDASLTAGLPAGKYLLFGGSVNDPATVGKVVDDLVNPITAELSKVEGKEAASVGKYVAALKKYITATKGQAVGMLAPTGAMGQEPIFQVISIQSGDPATMKGAYQEMMSTQQELMGAMGGPAASMMKTTTTPNAKTLAGVSFDLTHTEITAGNDPNAAQIDQMMKMIYGPDGMNWLTGASGDKLIVAFGANDATLTSTIAAMKANEDSLSKMPGVTAVAAQLPKSRVFSLYVPLDEIVTTVGTYAGAMGMPIQIQLPPDLPPIGITAGTDGTAIRIDSYTPTELIKALVAQGMQIYMQRMGGGPGGPGGL